MVLAGRARLKSTALQADLLWVTMRRAFFFPLALCLALFMVPAGHAEDNANRTPAGAAAIEAAYPDVRFLEARGCMDGHSVRWVFGGTSEPTNGNFRGKTVQMVVSQYDSLKRAEEGTRTPKDCSTRS